LRKTVALPLRSQTASQIKKAEKLCAKCLERQGISKSGKIAVEAELCEICHGSIDNIPAVAKNITADLERYEFDSFLVGASIPQRMLDKEDEFRSKYKIRGVEAIKAQITRMITREIVRNTGKTVDYARPDVTVLISLETGENVITPRSIWLMAWYKKAIRGLAQRSSICGVCNGLGCAVCNYKGTSDPSIQSLISSFFMKKFRAEGCSFIWIGSEDEKSTVDGSGRPFYVEIHKPRKRKLNKSLLKPFSISEGLTLRSVQVLQSRPKSIPQFKMKCLVYLSKSCEPEEGVQSGKGPYVMSKEIESNFRDRFVQVKISRKFRTVSRLIRNIEVMQNLDNHPYVLKIDCDGGIPIRKLVNGNDGAVSPSLSEYISGYVIDPEIHSISRKLA
jgi:tRNA pseudouridine synthase 10